MMMIYEVTINGNLTWKVLVDNDIGLPIRERYGCSVIKIVIDRQIYMNRYSVWSFMHG